MGVLSHLGERSWITRRSRESKASCQDSVSFMWLLLILALSLHAKRPRSHPCPPPALKHLVRCLTKTWLLQRYAHATGLSGNCCLALRSYRWWALNGQRLRLLQQLREVFCMARPQHRQQFLWHIVGNANLGGSPWCNKGFNNPPSHREQRG